MAERVAFLLRLDPELMASLRQWAGDDLRSLNSQIEFLLRRSLQDANRLPAGGRNASTESDNEARPGPGL